MEPLKGAKLFLARAKDDEILLEEIITNERIREQIIGFHAQQAAEKLLKAFLMARSIPVKERYGSKNRALLRCNTCKHCFSETRCTIFFRLETPDDEILIIPALVPEKGSIRGTARATRHDKDTICRWLDIAGAHCQ